jgi:hypothetical protein
MKFKLSKRAEWNLLRWRMRIKMSLEAAKQQAMILYLKTLIMLRGEW